MRQIFQMLTDLANEDLKSTISEAGVLNARMQKIREGFRFMDAAMSNPHLQTTQEMRESMTTADFPLYFGTAISRAFYKEYESKTSAWRDYTFADEAPNFTDIERFRTSEFETLEKRSELGEVMMTHVEEEQIKYSVDEYAKAFGLSWRVIVNDDMGEIRRFPSKLLRSALRFEDAFVSNLYDNPTSHAALLALGDNYSQSLALTVENLKIAYAAFMARTDANGNPINIVPKYLVTHPTMELDAKEILAGIDTSSSSPKEAVTRGLVQWRPDPYIGVPTHWYLFADPNDVAGVSVARLRGHETPQVYMKQPDAVPFNNGSLGTAAWTTGDFLHGQILFQVIDIIGGWDDAVYEGITDYNGIFHSSYTPS